MTTTLRMAALAAGLLLVLGAAAEPRRPDDRKPAAPPRRYSTRAWTSAADTAFAGKREERLPAGLVFPVTDEKGKVRADGLGISRMASILLTLPRTQGVTANVGMTEDVLTAAGCNRTGSLLDPVTITLCRKAAKARWHVFAQLTPRKRGYELTITFQGADLDGPARQNRAEVAYDGLHEIPGLIARSILENLGAAPSPEWDALPEEVPDEEPDFLTLCALWEAGSRHKASEEWLGNLAKSHPRSTVAWDAWLHHTKAPKEAVKALQELLPPLGHAHLQLRVAELLCQADRAEDALLPLLKLAGSEADDPAYYAGVFRCATRMRDEVLAEHLLAHWTRLGKHSAHAVRRGQMLIDWAWQARGGDWADKVTEEGFRLFKERLGTARANFKQALKDNPDNWPAHVGLITVAMGLGQPRAEMEAHFKSATHLFPSSYGAWWAKLHYLMPRWHGSLEDFLQFGRECIDSGRWEDGIPQLVVRIIADVCSDTASGATVPGRLGNPQAWDLARAYYRGAQKAGSREDRIAALNRMVLWGLNAGRDEETAVALQKLAPDEYRPQILGERSDIAYLRDVVHARSGKLPVHEGQLNNRDLASASVALATGDLDAAEQSLQRVAGLKLSGADTSVRRLQEAVRLGRRLAADKTLDLTPGDVLKTFLGAESRFERDETRVISNLQQVGECHLECPLGLKNCIITGTLEWTGNVSYVELRAHTRKVGDRLVMRYLPERNTILLMRNLHVIREEVLRPGPQHFRLEYRGGKELLSPCAGVTWEPVVLEDQASSFGFQAGSPGAGPATLFLSDLHIEWKD